MIRKNSYVAANALVHTSDVDGRGYSNITGGN
jgi:hypothetical protein